MYIFVGPLFPHEKLPFDKVTLLEVPDRVEDTGAIVHDTRVGTEAMWHLIANWPIKSVLTAVNGVYPLPWFPLGCKYVKRGLFLAQKPVHRKSLSQRLHYQVTLLIHFMIY